MQFPKLNFKMSDNSLFAILLRKPWWVSLAIAVAILVAGRFIFSERFAFIAYSFALPFAVIVVMALWRQKDMPGAVRVEKTVEATSAMSWKEFAELLEAGLKREGYTVARVDGGIADFRVVKDGRISLLCAKRWKAANLGVEPLRELIAQRDKEEVRGAIFVTTGLVTDNAQAFAREKKIELWLAPDVTRFVRLPKKAA